MVGDEIARLRWLGSSETQVSSLFDAPGGARRVTLAEGMSLLLDEGENHLVVLRGRVTGPDTYADLSIVVDVADTEPEVPEPTPPGGAGRRHRDRPVSAAHRPSPASGTSPSPSPSPGSPAPTTTHARRPTARSTSGSCTGTATPGTFERAQRVDDAIRVISLLVFGPKDDPFQAGAGRAQNVRFAIGRRTAEVRIVTVEDLETVERAASARRADREGAGGVDPAVPS